MDSGWKEGMQSPINVVDNYLKTKNMKKKLPNLTACIL